MGINDLRTRERNKALIESCATGPAQLNHPLSDKTIEALQAIDALPVAWWTNQALRAVSSVGANYAEGIGRSDRQDRLKFLKNARGSAYEAVYWAKLSKDGAFIRLSQEISLLIDQECSKLAKSKPTGSALPSLARQLLGLIEEEE